MWTYQNGKLIEQPSMEKPKEHPANYSLESQLYQHWFKEWEVYNEHLSSLRTLPVSDELKKVLVKGGEYEENLDFFIIRYVDDNNKSAEIAEPISYLKLQNDAPAIPIEPQGIAMTGDFKKEDVLLPETTAEEYFENRKRTIRGEDFLDKEDFLSFVAMQEYKLTAPDPTDKTEGEGQSEDDAKDLYFLVDRDIALGAKRYATIKKIKSQFSIKKK